jgi:hypothetical protein
MVVIGDLKLAPSEGLFHGVKDRTGISDVLFELTIEVIASAITDWVGDAGYDI